jgi:futalosine hydrolase
MPALDATLSGRRALLVVAVNAEANALRRGLGLSEASHPSEWTRHELNERFDLVVSGVGKSNAAGAAARGLDPMRHACVLNFGIAGALLSADHTTPIGTLVLASRSVLADEGMRTPDADGFRSLAQMGFAPINATGPGSGDGMGVDADPALLDALRTRDATIGPIATVSTCSACDALAEEIAHRTGAVAEAMEGAAVATVANALGVRFLEVRAISNTTGDRARQQWNIAAALETLTRFIALV